MASRNEKQLNLEQVKQLLRYDKDTGEVFWNERKRGRPIDKEAGTQDRYGYRWIKLNGHTFSLPRLVWYYHYGVFPKENIDYKNGNPKDLRITNLKEIGYLLHQERQRARRISTEGAKGVYKNKHGMWMVRIMKDGKAHTRGPFLEPADAYASHKQLSQDLFGDLYQPVAKKITREFTKEELQQALEEYLNKD